MNVRQLKREAIERCEAQIAEHAEENKDLDACQDLWRTVIERAVMDLQYLQRFAGRNNLKKHELEKLRRIEENPPTDFIEGSWFEEICAYLQIDATRVRSGLDDYLEQAA
jgi:hypothetical protein|tara:strand:+ start:152 stop:481 length:330 start_codon:yes stop_codon:yes gene_type:complete